MPHLFEPFITKHLSLRNRLVFPPMATAKSQADGTITQDVLDYYRQRSQGGYIGMIIVEHSYISPQGKATAHQMGIHSDDCLPGLRQLADVIKKDGSKAVIQINHAGSACDPDLNLHPTLAPSPIKNIRKGFLPDKVMNRDDMLQVIEEFQLAARRAKTAGFDGVEIHCAHGYLLNQFYSPLSNHRTDEYGGTLENRLRLPLEVVTAVRCEVGPDYPVLLRLGACDYMEGGTVLEDSIAAAKMFEKAGVTLLDISGGHCGYTIPEASAQPQGYFSSLTQPIKQAVSVPVILTGGITDARAADHLLVSEKADLAGVGRAIYKDSAWMQRACEEYLL
ncbi:NADH:flavin oxidoreductase [Lactonifactor sp. BIOML-A3]|uniref:oxidoreductase n=1 Tax=unclassified Lactonifactor TaxID=2636670 RepID=UPI0012AFA1D3|nr:MULTISPECIES: NADH:flavin oxidoreductase [unclassified Lactonifactor]MSA00852.1 NADH:flavin oxidoreductase [Lactonifactor sp. BIOML-A5]MSA07646.1 NADH:flavin oxidoreductase [Lactonifactor sp. BIOML-A4]MSA11842.1 NADH:flavin oxidoreductase [Lactonifactor sp. BIOML-A3]MSA16282.1 NADH:flavin oxidoreductase [Lactonifactor sp. BIOML-A2]MSA36886.1 NADH:flavin oxidoreductase [Lactonifactor sp. BIOML-A1]